MWSRRVLSALVLRPLALALVCIEVTGKENVPAEPLILMINHTNFTDAGVAMVVMLPRETTLFTKAENLHIPVGGLLLRWYGAIPVQRGEPDVAAVRRASQVLREKGSVLLVAPEGTRSHHGRLLPGKNGMAYLATRTGVPILPCAVSGAQYFWSNARRLRRTRVGVAIGHPFRLCSQGRARGETLDAMTREAMYQLAALLPPEQRGTYADLENASEEHLEFLTPGVSNLAYARLGSLPDRVLYPWRLARTAECSR